MSDMHAQGQQGLDRGNARPGDEYARSSGHSEPRKRMGPGRHPQVTARVRWANYRAAHGVRLAHGEVRVLA